VTTHDRIDAREQDFDVASEYDWLTADNTEDGAVVHFVGRMRGRNDGHTVHCMTLEHYPAMTRKALAELVTEARAHWSLGRVGLIHRVGSLFPGDQIVWVGVTSPHRADAFAACEYLMDALKTRAPFWKKESRPDGDHWVEARHSDAQRAARWTQPIKDAEE